MKPFLIGVAALAGVAAVVLVVREGVLPHPRHTYGLEVQRRR